MRNSTTWSDPSHRLPTRLVPSLQYTPDVELFLAALGPVLGLLGIVLGVWIGHRQWQRDFAKKNAESFESHLREAYFGLWDVVEDAHLKMRAALDGLTPEVFSGFLADVNNFMIKHGLYIQRDDRLLVLEYLFWTNEYLRILAQSPRGRALIEISLAAADWDGPDNREFGTQMGVLSEVQERAQALRNRLRDRIREVVGGPRSDAWSSDHKPSGDFLFKLDALVDAVQERQSSYEAPAQQVHLPESPVDWLPVERDWPNSAPSA